MSIICGARVPFSKGKGARPAEVVGRAMPCGGSGADAVPRNAWLFCAARSNSEFFLTRPLTAIFF